jgi:hypothetical protein
LKIINNSSTDTISVSVNSHNFQIDNSSCKLDKQLQLSIVGPNFISWTGSLNDLYKTSTSLGNFLPRNSRDFIFTVFLPQATGNLCQNKTTSFDFQLTFAGEPVSHPRPHQPVFPFLPVRLIVSVLEFWGQALNHYFTH